MMRRKGFVIGVFVVLGLLVLYDVIFFMKGKPSTAAAEIAAPESGSASGTVEALARRTADGPASPVASLRVEFTSVQSDFSREPFLLPIEEREGKSLKTILADEEEQARKQIRTEDPELMKKLRSLSLSGIVCASGKDRRGVSARTGVKRLALIDGELVGEGAVLPEVGATVVRISAREVELRAGDVTHVLKLSPLSPLGLEMM